MGVVKRSTPARFNSSWTPINLGITLRSGRRLKPWSSIPQRQGKNRRSGFQIKPFPFLKLPAELRNEVYKHLVTNPGKPSDNPQHVPWSRTGYGRIAIYRKKDGAAMLFPGSTVPSLTFLSTCRQIYHEAKDLVYEHNIVEVAAHRHTCRTSTLELPQGLRLDKVQYLRVLTDTMVSSRTNNHAWQILESMTSLRSIRIAMETDWIRTQPEVNAYMEFMDIIIWVAPRIKLELGIWPELKDMFGKSSSPWVEVDVLKLYAAEVASVRGLSLGEWNMEKALNYIAVSEQASKYSLYGFRYWV